jgi:hypothetical protein
VTSCPLRRKFQVTMQFSEQQTRKTYAVEQATRPPIHTAVFCSIGSFLSPVFRSSW